MKKTFWDKVWYNDTIGFHQDDIHSFLPKHIKRVSLPPEAFIFVPFCGKSLDMVWLSQFAHITGVELSPIACEDFFKENNLSYQHTDVSEGLTRLHNNRYTLWQGDFYLLNTTITEHHFDMIYDRAALIALPVGMRTAYVEKLKEFISKETTLLLISLEFPESEMSGPPFPVFKNEVHDLFSEYDIKEVDTQDLTTKKFARRTFPVTSLIERLYVITPK